MSITTKCHLALPGREGSKTLDWPGCSSLSYLSILLFFYRFHVGTKPIYRFRLIAYRPQMRYSRIPSYLTISHQIGYRFHETTEAERTPDTCDKSLWSPASEYALAQVRSSLSSSGFVKTIVDLMEYHEVWRSSRNIWSLACKPWERNDRLASYQRRIDKRTAKYWGVTERNNSVSPRFLTPPGREVPNGTIDIFSNL